MPPTPPDNYIATSEPMTHSKGILAVRGVRIDPKKYEIPFPEALEAQHTCPFQLPEKSHLAAKPVFHRAEFSDSYRESDCNMSELL